MASLTIRDLEEALKGRLRVRAASRGRSMEEEARHILRAALNEPLVRQSGLVDRIRRRFSEIGDVELAIAPREAVRDAPVRTDTAKSARARRAAGSGAPARSSRRA